MHYTTAQLAEIRTFRKLIGRNIYKLRASKGMTLHKLSRFTGINARLLDHYELGRNEISLEILLCISAYFRKEIGYFLQNEHSTHTLH